MLYLHNKGITTVSASDKHSHSRPTDSIRKLVVAIRRHVAAAFYFYGHEAAKALADRAKDILRDLWVEFGKVDWVSQLQNSTYHYVPHQNRWQRR